MDAEHSFPELNLRRPNLPGALAAWLRRRPGFAIFVILPVILGTIYFGFVAPDIYVSESRFVISSPNQKRAQLSTLANLVQTTGLSAGQEQANEIMDYVESRDALGALLKTSDARRKIEPPESSLISFFHNILSGNTFEDLYESYRGAVSANLDTETGLVVLKVRGYNPRDAFQLNAELLKLSENLVNKMNVRAREKAISEAQLQVDLATKRAKQALIAMSQFRNAKGLLDPDKQGLGVITIADQLVAQRAALRAQLESMQRLTPSNPTIPALRDRIEAISAQIAAQNSQVAGTDGAIASKMEGYDALVVEQKFATESLVAANAALVRSESEAAQQQFYLDRIVDPNQPDKAQFPHRLLDILIVAGAALCLYFIGWMFVIGILEHAPED